jgi:pantoate--beta-alanine ligase
MLFLRSLCSIAFSMNIPVIRSVTTLRQQSWDWQRLGHKVAVVPTMGALHEGHLFLVKEAFRRADKVIVTIFVNPRQFAAHEDLGRYPRDEAGDLAKLATVGASVVFAPTTAEMYPDGASTSIVVAGPAKVGLEDRFRPHFFDGVATVVAKLFVQSGANYAFFGEKDYQQLAVVKQMARDLDLPIEVIGVPTVREPDGLAMSSRNRYLSRAERLSATAIFRVLTQAAEKIRRGLDPVRACHDAQAELVALGFKPDYVEPRNSDTLQHLTQPSEPIRLLAAAWLGKTRLIDNIQV